MLVITFGRAASQELRERVREPAGRGRARARRPGRGAATTGCSATSSTGDAAELAERRDRLRDALAGFDAATIATTHQFCQLVLRSLGVAGDTDAGVTLVESLDDLVVEVVDDLYLQRFGGSRRRARRSPAPARSSSPARSSATRRPRWRPSDAAGRVGRGRPRSTSRDAVRAEVERRKRRRGILGYDDLLSRLADALEDRRRAGPRSGCAGAGRIVLVDEFQDTDPVQWEVLDARLRRARHAGPDR